MNSSSSLLSLLGVAAARHRSPPHPVLRLLFTDTCLLHILLYIVIPPPPRLPSCPLPWYFNFHHSSAYVVFFPSLHMPEPSQSLSPQLLLSFSSILLIFAVPQMYSFLTLSFSVTPSAHLTIFSSAASIFFTILPVTATVSIPYNTAGLTAHL